MTGPFDNVPTIDPAGAVTGTGATAREIAREALAGPLRYPPGSIVGGRYRLVALLGRGGMGEVYRADDLTLDQPVALKFLPEDLRGADDANRLAQFHNELRIARQVSHKNVCRLYDLGEADGHRFLTMEYVDGEDLGALLRRIGRFPQDRAITIARQLCAGVAAAHERGVIHRDLKPANVMIDGEGNVRITDFGIATAGAEPTAPLAGTPQYMAPEQLRGATATTASDIYALGLLLFEIFTGKRVHSAQTIADLRAQHDTGTVTTPSSIVRDLDPRVERIILRCLESDPARRPTSALAVAVSLPGGQSLEDALASGATPSPELLASAAETDALPLGRGLAAVVWIVAGLAACVVFAPRATLARLVPLEKPPAVLADRAEQILAAVGYGGPRGDSAEGFEPASDYIAWIARTDRGPTRWSRLSTGFPALFYWYRTSPRELVPRQLALRVTPDEPPADDTGMHTVVLDTRGRLLQLHSVPPELDTEASASRPGPFGPGASGEDPAPWPTLFEAAGLSITAFAPVAPQWTPRGFADTRAAWEGPLPDDPEVRVRVESAAYRGRPVSFHIVGPWTQPTRMQPPPERAAIDRIGTALVAVAGFALLAGAVVLARHNVRVQRADTAGATTLGAAAFTFEMAAWLFGYQHDADFRVELSSFSAIAADAAFLGITLWLVYAALEPYCRRFWPDMLLGWSRLLAGHIRDARVGRDALVGASAGILWFAIDLARRLLPQALGYSAVVPEAGSELNFVGAPCDACNSLSTWSVLVIRQLLPAFLALLLFVVLRLITRRQSAAILLGAIAIFFWWSALGDPTSFWIEFSGEALIVVLFTTVMIRFGVLAALVALFVVNVCQVAPLTPDVTHWSAPSSNLTIALLIALTVFGFVASRAGQPLFGKVLTD